MGKIFLQALHRKYFILLVHSSFHIDFHVLTILEESEHSSWTSFPFALHNTLRAISYALLTVNLPLLDHAHFLESFGRLGLIGIPKTTFASKGRKVFRTFSMSYEPLSLSRRCSTISTIVPWFLGLTTLKELGVGNHLSYHTLTLLPLPILHLNPLSMMLLDSIKLLHVYEGLFPNWASIKHDLLKYFAFSTLWSKGSGFGLFAILVWLKGLN